MSKYGAKDPKEIGIEMMRERERKQREAERRGDEDDLGLPPPHRKDVNLWKRGRKG